MTIGGYGHLINDYTSTYFVAIASWMDESDSNTLACVGS